MLLNQLYFLQYINGGWLRFESWQANVDHLLNAVATNACKGGRVEEERSIFLCDEPTPLWADFQLASLRALLASLLSRGRVRLPYLSLGMQEMGSCLAEYFRNALLALEVLIHPRVLPLVDFSSTGLSCKVPRNVQTSILEKVVRDHSSVNLFDKNESGAFGSGARIVVDKINVMVELQETNRLGGDKSGGHVPSTVADYPCGHTSRAVSKSDVLDPIDIEMAPVCIDTAMECGTVIITIHENVEKNVLGSKDGGFNTISNYEKSKVFTSEFDNESSLYSILDIIYGDPDSE
ncbi:unnamed protein product [Fraxinus pennsylvanica]|uniref:Uncharacterized protein n=1 Tax=Fraxinus pennsylvanica TaxID=56036 RepID=A0AAD1ZWK2_9LAMI|nr:unnamed protein product [Fraxinus pennsylvanica]